ncbi:hypothetical protein Poli38472_001884 [Pythium oligandrum]|uniref:C2 domain-containing protein n=1 Tax=Pythium oligandrum TaxID=41045 RepID=A0A8K1CWW2_PYTOL|nr:hypothetical protein Poli38472_001884 [Pythium oligandrum]|eukprot:TMW69728.1 hypothetical protein Poli38472_001884 [Pythium oligandrum]
MGINSNALDSLKARCTTLLWTSDRTQDEDARVCTSFVTKEHEKPVMRSVAGQDFNTEARLKDIILPDEKDLLWRRKICVIGSSNAGKTSLVKAIASEDQSVGQDNKQTFDVELYRIEFQDEDTSEGPANNRHYEATLWYFSGQDVCHAAHVPFFSGRPLYLLCVDVKEFDRVVREPSGHGNGGQPDSSVASFVQERVWCWLRLIVLRQPKAEIVLVATNSETLGSNAKPQLEHLEIKLIVVLKELEQTLISEIQREVDALCEQSTAQGCESSDDERINHLRQVIEHLERSVPSSWVAVNVVDPGGVQYARLFIEDMVKRSSRNVQLPDKYPRVLHKLKHLGQAAGEDRIRQCFVALPDLLQVLMDNIQGLTEVEAIAILEALHDSGDVLWCARDGLDFLGNTIILDVKLLVDLIREIIGHDSAFSSDIDQVDRLLQDMPLNGWVADELLRYKFPYWKKLAYPDQMLQVKQLLRHFNLVFPAGGGEMRVDSDLIDPARWRNWEQYVDLETLESLSINGVDGKHRKKFLWEFDLEGNSDDVINVVFEQLVVRTYYLLPDCVIHGHCVESVENGRFAIRIACGMIGGRGPVIRLEDYDVRGQDASIRLHRAPEVIEDVLKTFPGILVTRKTVTSDRHSNLFTKVRNAWQDMRPLQVKEYFSLLLNRVLGWFRRSGNKAKKTGSGKCDLSQVLEKLSAMERKMDRHHEAALKVIVSEAQRRVPQCWTVECVSDYSLIVKVRSDLTGKCYHDPIHIPKVPDFIEKYKKCIQVGLNVFVGMMPGAIAKGILDGLQPDLDKSMAAASVTKAMHLERGEVVNMDGIRGLHPDSIDAMLQDLLQIKFQDYANKNFDHLKVSSYCNLQIETESSCESAEESWRWGELYDCPVNLVGSPFNPLYPVVGAKSRPGSCTSTVGMESERMFLNCAVLKLTVLSAENLPMVCLVTRQQPYCRWTLLNPDGKVIRSEKTHPDPFGGDKPKWNQHFDVEIGGNDELLLVSKLVFHVKTRRGYGGSSTVGKGEITIIDDDFGRERYVPLELKNKRAGRLRLSHTSLIH